MKESKEKPTFNVWYKEFTGKLVTRDIIPALVQEAQTKQKKAPIKDKEELKKIIQSYCIYHYWAKCEWEFVIVDWPPKRDSIKDSHPVKVDVWEQIKGNLDVVVNLVWEALKKQ